MMRSRRTRFLLCFTHSLPPLLQNFSMLFLNKRTACVLTCSGRSRLAQHSTRQYWKPRWPLQASSQARAVSRAVVSYEREFWRCKSSSGGSSIGSSQFCCYLARWRLTTGGRVECRSELHQIVVLPCVDAIKLTNQGNFRVDGVDCKSAQIGIVASERKRRNIKAELDTKNLQAWTRLLNSIRKTHKLKLTHTVIIWAHQLMSGTQCAVIGFHEFNAESTCFGEATRVLCIVITCLDHSSLSYDTHRRLDTLSGQST